MHKSTFYKGRSGKNGRKCAPSLIFSSKRFNLYVLNVFIAFFVEESFFPSKGNIGEKCVIFLKPLLIEKTARPIVSCFSIHLVCPTQQVMWWCRQCRLWPERALKSRFLSVLSATVSTPSCFSIYLWLSSCLVRANFADLFI